MGSTQGLPTNIHIKKSLGWLEKRLKKEMENLGAYEKHIYLAFPSLDGRYF